MQYFNRAAYLLIIRILCNPLLNTCCPFLMYNSIVDKFYSQKVLVIVCFPWYGPPSLMYVSLESGQLSVTYSLCQITFWVGDTYNEMKIKRCYNNPLLVLRLSPNVRLHTMNQRISPSYWLQPQTAMQSNHFVMLALQHYHYI